MMRIFNVHNEKKRSKSVCNYQQFTMREINKKKCEDEVKRQRKM